MVAQDIQFLRSATEVRSATAPETEALPSEFLIFKTGANPNTNYGDVVFDATASKNVMADQAKRGGVQYMADLEHQSLGFSLNPAGSDALAWFDIQTRPSGLWGTNVVWTDAGAARLRARSQRYLSPAFCADWQDGDYSKTARVTRLINVALVSRPALYGTPALASQKRPSDITTPAVGVRLSILQKVRLEQRAAAAGTTVSAILRGFVDAGLSETETQYALEIADPEKQANFVHTRQQRRAQRAAQSAPIPVIASGEFAGLNEVEAAHALGIKDPEHRARFIARRRERHAK